MCAAVCGEIDFPCLLTAQGATCRASAAGDACEDISNLDILDLLLEPS